MKVIPFYLRRCILDLQFVLPSLLYFWGKSHWIFGHNLIFIYSYWNKNMSHFFRSATLLWMDKYKCQEYEEHSSNFQNASESQKWCLVIKIILRHRPWLNWESGSGFDWGVRNVTREVRRDGYLQSQPFDIPQLKWLMETKFLTMGLYFKHLKMDERYNIIESLMLLLRLTLCDTWNLSVGKNLNVRWFSCKNSGCRLWP